MKKDIHPEYKEVIIKCTCGNEIRTHSTRDSIHVEVCSSCHPVYQKLIKEGEIPDLSKIN